MTKERQIMNFLNEYMFNPIINSPEETPFMKQGVNVTISHLENMSADEMIKYFWSTIVGMERSTHFARYFRKKEFVEAVEAFRKRFNDDWLKE